MTDEKVEPEVSSPNLPVVNNEAANSLNLPVSIAAQVMIGGIIEGTKSTPVETVMRAIAYHVGFGMSSKITGDLSALINVRKSMQDAFQEGVRKAPLNANPANMPAPFSPDKFKQGGGH